MGEKKTTKFENAYLHINDWTELQWFMVFENIHLKPELRERKATAFRFLILFLKVGIFFSLWKFSPPPFLTAEYNFLNTAIFCSGNGTGMIFFQLDFFPSSARNVSPLPAAPFTCILSDRLPRDWLYSVSEEKLIIGIFQVLSLELVHLRTLPLNTAYIKWSSMYQLVHVAGYTFKLPDLKSGKQTDIPAN